MWYKIQKIYIWQTQVRPSGWWWHPWANTVAYYPLDSTNTVNDLSWNNYTLTTSHTNPTFWTYQWVDCASFNGSNTELKTVSVNPWTYWSSFTVSCWVYGTATWDRVPICNVYYNSTWLNRQIRAHSSWSSIFEFNGTSWTNTSFWISANAQAWHNLLFTANGNNITTYVDGAQVATGTNTKWNNNWTFTIWCGWDEADGYFWWFNWWLSNVIVENKVWTVDEVSEYYNQTKANYWIS